jgi:hypothetical protein
VIYFLENMHEKPLGFDCIHEDKTYFLCFWKEEINLIIFLIFFIFEFVWKKTFTEN